MKFKKWLINVKGLSIKTSKLYAYYAKKENWSNISSYNNRKPSSSKRIIYFAYKYFCEFKGIKSLLDIPPKAKQNKLTEVVTYNDYLNIQDNFIHNNTSTSINGKLLCKLTFIYGLRISEALSLHSDDINEYHIKVKGKGNKHRIIPIEEHLARTLSTYDGYVINNKGKKLSYSTAQNILKEIKEELSLNKNYTWHSFRHGFASRLLMNKVDLFAKL